MQKLPQDTDALLDAVLTLPERHIEWTIARLLDKHPGISTPGLMDLVTRRYVRVSQTASAGVGAGAAVPGSGLALGAALTGVELSVFAANTALYVLTMARLSGIPTQNLEARKTLVLSAILGDEASKVVYDQAGFGIWNWARAQVAENASATLSSVNKALAQFAGKKISKNFRDTLWGVLSPWVSEGLSDFSRGANSPWTQSRASMPRLPCSQAHNRHPIGGLHFQRMPRTGTPSKTSETAPARHVALTGGAGWGRRVR